MKGLEDWKRRNYIFEYLISLLPTARNEFFEASYKLYLISVFSP